MRCTRAQRPFIAPPPPFSALVARPPGGGQGGWVVPAVLPTDHLLPLHFPPERHVPAAQITPLPLGPAKRRAVGLSGVDFESSIFW